MTRQLATASGMSNEHGSLSHPEAPRPTIELRPLDWDTEFFGSRMGVLALNSSMDGAAFVRADEIERDLRSALAEAESQRYAHLIFRTPGEDLSAAWAAERAGMSLVDVGIDSTFRFGSSAVPEPRSAALIRSARSEDLPVLRDLAGEAFVLSRFAADPFFSPEQVVAFHRQWITNLCAGLAQAVLVHESDGGVAGFVSCAISGDEGRIPLIATQAAVRGHGVGRELVAAALQWFAAAGARVAHVKTQATNYPALALYHRSGFSVSHAELTFSVASGRLASHQGGNR